MLFGLGLVSSLGRQLADWLVDWLPNSTSVS